MATCPAGHDSATDDYCDTCGAPIAVASTESPRSPDPAASTPGTAPPAMEAPLAQQQTLRPRTRPVREQPRGQDPRDRPRQPAPPERPELRPRLGRRAPPGVWSAPGAGTPSSAASASLAATTSSPAKRPNPPLSPLLSALTEVTGTAWWAPASRRSRRRCRRSPSSSPATVPPSVESRPAAVRTSTCHRPVQPQTRCEPPPVRVRAPSRQGCVDGPRQCQLQWHLDQRCRRAAPGRADPHADRRRSHLRRRLDLPDRPPSPAHRLYVGGTRRARRRVLLEMTPGAFPALRLDVSSTPHRFDDRFPCRTHLRRSAATSTSTPGRRQHPRKGARSADQGSSTLPAAIANQHIRPRQNDIAPVSVTVHRSAPLAPLSGQGAAHRSIDP
jgi:hypothetical protein